MSISDDAVAAVEEDWSDVTIPNAITLLRLFMVPAVVYALLAQEMGWALAGFVVAGLSDGIDGFIARRWPSQRSELGAWLDPVADKLLLVSVFLVLGLSRELPLWLVVMVISRDVLIVGGVLVANLMGRPMNMRPLAVSKVNTAAQILLIALVLADLTLDMGLGTWRNALAAAVGLLTAASAGAYLVAWLRHMSGHGEGENQRG